MVVSSVGVSAAEMKVPRTLRDDMSTFTRLLRCLGHLGDDTRLHDLRRFNASPH